MFLVTRTINQSVPQLCWGPGKAYNHQNSSKFKAQIPTALGGSHPMVTIFTRLWTFLETYESAQRQYLVIACHVSSFYWHMVYKPHLGLTWMPRGEPVIVTFSSRSVTYPFFPVAGVQGPAHTMTPTVMTSTVTPTVTSTVTPTVTLST